MGSETTKALRARQREASTRVTRLIAEADAGSPIGSARRTRINSAVREGRRAITALGSAERAVADAEARAGAALIRITEDGLSNNEAFESLGISRAVGRRLINLSVSTRRAPAGLSTSTSTDPTPGANRADGETGAPSDATTKGNL
ncbi:hypothetical protein [Nocardioides marmoriginsengisoli]|uniref:hypothetical protein n=1 Tax=Nocardioides marmoriginsengisoli TaxID=661483 RepID=UPI0011CE2222|nr:hypothetical protein [Nocardioides marmoriginsengisoli]